MDLRVRRNSAAVFDREQVLFGNKTSMAASCKQSTGKEGR
jgi:hypothetical protein